MSTTLATNDRSWSEKYEYVTEHIAKDAANAFGLKVKSSDEHSFFHDWNSVTRSYVFGTSCEKGLAPDVSMSLHLERIGSHPITLELVFGYHCSSCEEDSWLKHPVEKYNASRFCKIIEEGKERIFKRSTNNKKTQICDIIEERISTKEFQNFLNKYGIKSKSLEDVYSEDYRAFNLLVTDREREAQKKQFLFSRMIRNLDEVYAKCFE